LADTQRLLELRNAELARLQAQASGTAPAPAATPPVPAPVNPAVTPAAPATAAPMAATPKAASPPAGSITDWIIEHWYVPVGLLALLLAGIMGLRAYRAREADEDDQSFDRLSSHAFDQVSSSTATLPVRVLPDTDASAILVEESGSHRSPAPAPKPVAAQPVQVDTPSVTNTAMALEQGDALAEADFHMAYGLYDQAAELVTQAIAREPRRRELRLKLLEVFFVWGNKERFLQLAHELAESRAEALPGEWEKIIIMGRQLAPEDSLFAGEGGVSAVAHAGVDLNLEGGQNRVDFDLMGEPLVGRHPDSSVDLDLGAALAADETATGMARAPGDSGVDFVLDDPIRGDDGALRTRELPRIDSSQKTAILDLSGSDSEGPTAEMPQLDAADRGTIRMKLEGHAGQSGGGTSGEPTAELALDDLGLDLGTLTSQSLTTPRADERLDATAAAPLSADSGASGRWPIADTGSGEPPAVSTEAPTLRLGPQNDLPGGHAEDGFPSTSDTQAHPQQSIPASGATTRSNSLRLDSGDFNADVGLTTSEANALAATSTRATTLSASALTDLEPPTMSEVGTKLDLARAYMDMGDPEGARNILEEVLAEGSASQKQEARRLIDSLPG
jgi:pilus assembly protein FimV